jgi:hypothetical protein
MNVARHTHKQQPMSVTADVLGYPGAASLREPVERTPVLPDHGSAMQPWAAERGTERLNR